MKRSKFSDSQIVGILKEGQGGVRVSDLCRLHGISTKTFYNWRSRYGGADVSMLSELKALQEENRRLKKMYADVQLQKECLQEALQEKW